MKHRQEEDFTVDNVEVSCVQICMCETRNIPHQHNGAVVPEPESQRKFSYIFNQVSYLGIRLFNQNGSFCLNNAQN